MIADMLSNKKHNPTVTKPFIKERKLSISLVFILQLYFTVPTNVLLNLIIHQILTFRILES